MTIVPVCRCGHTAAAHAADDDGNPTHCQICDNRCRAYRYWPDAPERRGW